MALCPTLPNPSTTGATQALTAIDNPPSPFFGDFQVYVAGTRNFGNGTFRVNALPKGSTVTSAQLVVNVYLDNSQPDPTVTFNGTPLNNSPLSLSGSTCWLNPGGELTTYLRNRVYTYDVTSLGVDGNGKYQITGLPVNLSMPIGSDGDRLPGCTSSQGAALFIAYLDPQAITERTYVLYAGSVLVTPNPATWGPGGLGTQTYDLPFDALDFNSNVPYPGNGKVVLVAGDIHPSIGGVQLAINATQFAPFTNAFFNKCGNSVVIKSLKTQLYPTFNQLQLASNGNCVNLFLFAWSGDATPQTEKFTEVNCVATKLKFQLDAKSGPDTVVAVPVVTDAETMQSCGFGIVGNQFGQNGPPFYIKIDGHADDANNGEGEIMQVVQANFADGSDCTGEGDQQQYLWSVNRAQGGTNPAPHAPCDCIRLIMSSRGNKAMMKQYAGKGLPSQRPNSGNWQGRYSTC